MSETPAKAPVETLGTTPDLPASMASNPIKRFSEFEDAMLESVRELYQNEDRRREVAKRIS